jgi:hypothetical protein
MRSANTRSTTSSTLCCVFCCPLYLLGRLAPRCGNAVWSAQRRRIAALNTRVHPAIVVTRNTPTDDILAVGNRVFHFDAAQGLLEYFCRGEPRLLQEDEEELVGIVSARSVGDVEGCTGR